LQTWCLLEPGIYSEPGVYQNGVYFIIFRALIFGLKYLKFSEM